MPAAPLTPEECYQRALRSIEAGHFERAIKLLKIATLRAPDDPRFRDALHRASSAHEEARRQTATADPHALLAEALARHADGDTEAARKLLQIARARAPQDPEIRAAADKLRGQAADPPPVSDSDRHAKAIKDVAQEAAEEARRPPPPPKPAAARPPSRGRLLALSGVLVLLLVVGAAVFLLTRTERPADASPYASILPVQQARAVGTDSEELVLVIASAGWRQLDADAQRSRLQQTLRQAIIEGHRAVFVYDEASTLLGSATPDTVYLP